MNEILAKSLLNKVERLEALEERLSVRFENISIKVVDTGWVYLFCELHSNNGTTINERIKVECVLYNEEGAIIKKNSIKFYPEDFFAFEVIELLFSPDDISGNVGKIRIYPKK